MNRGDDFFCPSVGKEFAPVSRDAKITSHERLSSGSSQADQEFRLDRREFRLQPGTACGDLDAGRFGVDSALTRVL